MKRIISIASVILVITQVSFSAERVAKPVLKFRSEGIFKIVQFTDVHFRYDSYRSDSALNMMKTVIAIEKPDLVVLTGDIVCSKNTAKAWISLSKVCIDAKVPWTVMLGNHDPQDVLTWYEDFNNKPKLPDFYGEPVRTKDIPLPNAGNINTKSYPGKIIDGKDLTFKGGSHRTLLTIIPEDTAKDIASKLPEVPVSPSNHYANFSKPVKEKKKTALRSRLQVHYVR